MFFDAKCNDSKRLGRRWCQRRHLWTFSRFSWGSLTLINIKSGLNLIIKRSKINLTLAKLCECKVCINLLTTNLNDLLTCNLGYVFSYITKT